MKVEIRYLSTLKVEAYKKAVNLLWVSFHGVPRAHNENGLIF